MVSIGVEVTTVKARVCVVLIQGLSLSQVDPGIVLPQPVAILHLRLPAGLHQLEGTLKIIIFKHTDGVTHYQPIMHMLNSV